MSHKMLSTPGAQIAQELLPTAAPCATRSSPPRHLAYMNVATVVEVGESKMRRPRES